MTHYRMLDRVPSVILTSNKNELKVYQGNIVYLNDGDNFELRFFNPLPEKIGVEINFNGMKKGDGYLVLNPGQDLILDRFLDEQRKMLFETYTIDGNNEAAVKAIEKNGLISFNFYKEYGNYHQINDNIKINYDFPPKPYRPKIKNTYNTTNNYYGGSGTSGSSGGLGTSGSSGINGVSGPCGSPGFSGTGGGGTQTRTFGGGGGLGHFTNIGSAHNLWKPIYKNPGVFTTEIDQSYSDYLAENLDKSIDFSEYIAQSTNTVTYDSYLQNVIETGRVEKGDISDQRLKSVNLQFNPNPFYSISYQIMPYSQMNRSIGEVRQYCENCGYRIRKESWKYCPKCGNHLI